MLCTDRSDDGRVPGGDERLLGQHERGPVLHQLVQRDLGPAPPPPAHVRMAQWWVYYRGACMSAPPLTVRSCRSRAVGSG